MQHGVLEEALAEAASARLRQHRNAEFGRCSAPVLRLAVVLPARRAMCEVGKGDQLELTVEDAEDLVVREVDRPDVALDLCIRRGVAEAQVARAFVERGEVGSDPAAVARPE
jgi:hypothetical protein